MSWEDAVLWLRNQPEQIELVRACFYDDPLLDAARRYYQSSEWQSVQSLVAAKGNGRRALDIGAGRGISSYALARDGWDVFALEPDYSEIVGSGAIRNLAKEAGLYIHVVEEYGERLPFDDATFDFVHCRQVLHHAGNLPILCKEIGRVLKPDGVMIATREHVISRKEDLQAFLDSHPLHKFYGGENAFLLGDYKKAIRGGGMRLTRVLNPLQSDINLFPETMNSKKKILANKVYWPMPALIPDWILGIIGSGLNNPGRMYTFVGRKI